MGRRFLVFFVDEDEQLHPFPYRRYERILNRTDAIYLYAGRTTRFVHAVVETTDDQRTRVVSVEFGQHTFDAAGLLDQEEKMKQLIAAAKMLEVPERSDWVEPYRYEYIKPYSWEPSEMLMEQLNTALQKKSPGK